MKKLFIVLFAALLFIPINAKADEKLKIYMFEAGDCPYCEAQMEYFKTLEGYDETFEVVRKELYVDHVDWKPGKDYDLGVTVADAFKNVGFEDASYEATPFVVISDVYAAAGYNTELDSIIKLALEEGDMDAVACFENDGENCIREEVMKSLDAAKNSEKTEYSTGSIASAIILIFVIIGIIFFTTMKKK